MKILEKRAALREWRLAHSKESIGFVPTMGALHAGHRSLLERARKENDRVALSIFVNPTQFNSADDFTNYPHAWEQDLAMAADCGVDAVFAPEAIEMYSDATSAYRITESEFSKRLCGAFRPGHFDGVLTVVMKFFQIIHPTRAYFGEKDRQQLELVRGMSRAFFLDVDIVSCPTVREPDGLALSSRNLRLSAQERAVAPELHRVITQVKNRDEAWLKLESSGFRVEYLEDIDDIRYVAAWLGKVRLIDNVPR